MKTYLFKTTAMVKEKGAKTYWLDGHFFGVIEVKAASVREAFTEYADILKGIEMDKKEKAIKIVQECDLYDSAVIVKGVFLESSQSMLAQAETWADDDPGRSLDYSDYPYWMTTDSGDTPLGITGADDPDLLRVIE